MTVKKYFEAQAKAEELLEGLRDRGIHSLSKDSVLYQMLVTRLISNYGKRPTLINFPKVK